MQNRIGAFGLCLTMSFLGAPAEESPSVQARVREPGEPRNCRGIVQASVAIDGRYSSVEAPYKQVASSPSWNPSNGEEIPLSVTEAFRLATAEFQRHFGDRKNWGLERVYLRPLCDDRWWYSFSFVPPTGVETGFVSVAVLMSGVVVHPAVPDRRPTAEKSEESGPTAGVRGCNDGAIAFGMIDGRSSNVQVPWEQITSTPSWNPSNGEEIPLSVAKAFRLATSEFQRNFGDRKNWALQELHLIPLCDDRWVYSFILGGEGFSAGVVVLMSGEVVSPAAESPERTLTAEVRKCEKNVSAFATIDGRFSHQKAHLEQIASSPSWNPSNGEPVPLSATEAFRLATSEFQRHFGERWALKHITLRPLCDDRWVYLFSFGPRTKGETGEIEVVVLMSGKVVLDSRGATAKSKERGPTAEAIGCFNFVNTTVLIDGHDSYGELVPLEQIASTPSWNPAKGEEIPLSLTEAFRLATSEFKRYVGARENWGLLQFDLRPLCDDRWTYSFSFLPMPIGEVGSIRVDVLMSGEVPLAVPDR